MIQYYHTTPRLSTMEYEEAIEKIIGKQNLKEIRKAITKGRLKIDKIRVIALKMKANVYGTYENNRKVEEPVNVFNLMLDTWYNEVICEPGVDGYKKLIDILKDDGVAQKALALKMTPVKPGVLQIGLPEGMPTYRSSSSCFINTFQNNEFFQEVQFSKCITSFITKKRI